MGEEAGPPGRRTRWSDDLEARFVKALGETGNVSASARAVGAHPSLLYARRRRDAGFATAWNEALAAAESVLKQAETPFERARFKARPVSVEGEGQGQLRPLADAGGEVIRRTSNGRVQIAKARAGQWTAAIESAFLDCLRETGNIAGAARAVGFDVSSVWERYRKWPGFAREWERMLEEASVALEFRLVCLGNNVVAGDERRSTLGRGSGERSSGTNGEAVAPPLDPEFALKFLKWREERRGGQGRRGRPPREPTIEEVKENILRKIEAIERHRAIKRKKTG